MRCGRDANRDGDSCFRRVRVSCGELWLPISVCEEPCARMLVDIPQRDHGVTVHYEMGSEPWVELAELKREGVHGVGPLRKRA
jgi:hypothetical protein